MFRRKTFYRLEMSEGTKVADHLGNLRSLIDQLARVGVVLLEEEAVFVLLASMPKTYEACVSSLANLTTLTLSDVAAALILEETHII